MFTNKIKSLLVAGTMALGAFGALAATSTTASASDFRGGVYIGGPGFSIGYDNRHRSKRHHRRHRDWKRPRNHYGYDRCRPGKAVRKARRRGVRDAFVARVGYRGVIVKGWKWGERVTIGFSNNHRCSVRFVRAR